MFSDDITNKGFFGNREKNLFYSQIPFPTKLKKGSIFFPSIIFNLNMSFENH